jgi:hypothetical protein
MSEDERQASSPKGFTSQRQFQKSGISSVVVCFEVRDNLVLEFLRKA